MSFGHLPNDGQSCAGPLYLASDRPSEEFEYPIALLRSHSRATVAHDQADEFVSFKIHPGMWRNLNVRSLPGGCKLERIRDQIIDTLDGPGGIDPQAGKGGANRDAGVGFFDALLQPM